MTERTIKKDELRTSLANLGIHFNGINEIIEAAFPPIFKPKEGEAIVVSHLKSFKNPKIRVFCYINDDDEYVCFMNGSVEKTTTVAFEYAKPQTPRNKGE
jgi:hypothetical protein